MAVGIFWTALAEHSGDIAFAGIMVAVMFQSGVALRLPPQVGLGSGFVDFKLDAKEESSIVIELKPLFHSCSTESG